MTKIKIPIPLRTFTVVATMALSLMVTDITIGENSADNSNYYWNDHLGRQYGSSSSYQDTSPNLANFVTSPGVAAALFFSTAGVCFFQFPNIGVSDMGFLNLMI